MSRLTTEDALDYLLAAIDTALMRRDLIPPINGVHETVILDAMIAWPKGANGPVAIGVYEDLVERLWHLRAAAGGIKSGLINGRPYERERQAMSREARGNPMTPEGDYRAMAVIGQHVVIDFGSHEAAMAGIDRVRVEAQASPCAHCGHAHLIGDREVNGGACGSCPCESWTPRWEPRTKPAPPPPGSYDPDDLS